MQGNGARSRRISYGQYSDESSDGWEEVRMVPFHNLKNKPLKTSKLSANGLNYEKQLDGTSHRERVQSKKLRKALGGKTGSPAFGYKQINLPNNDDDSDMSIHYRNNSKKNMEEDEIKMSSQRPAKNNLVFRPTSKENYQEIKDPNFFGTSMPLEGKKVNPEISSIINKIEHYMNCIHDLLSKLKDGKSMKEVQEKKNESESSGDDENFLAYSKQSR